MQDRIIKFRAWIPEETEMVDVDCIDFNEQWMISGTGFNTDFETGEEDVQFRLTQVKLMQYTGLKDKNGLEIYEGDILKVQMGDDDNDEWMEVRVVFENAAFRFVNASFEVPVNVESEVIGNIYENPELCESNQAKGV